MDSRMVEGYWNVVRQCLVELHKIPEAEAVEKVGFLRAKIDSPPPGVSNDIFYHMEPFYVACDLAGMQLDVSQFRSAYDAILDASSW